MSFDESCKWMLFNCVTDNLSTEAVGRFKHLMPSAEYHLSWTLLFVFWRCWCSKSRGAAMGFLVVTKNTCNCTWLL